MNACMHLLSTSSSKSAPGPSVFLTFFFGDQLLGDDDDDEDGGDDDYDSFSSCLCEIDLLPLSRAHFVDHRPKVLRAPQFLTCSSGNRAIATVLCTFC